MNRHREAPLAVLAGKLHHTPAVADAVAEPHATWHCVRGCPSTKLARSPSSHHVSSCNALETKSWCVGVIADAPDRVLTKRVRVVLQKHHAAPIQRLVTNFPAKLASSTFAAGDRSYRSVALPRLGSMSPIPAEDRVHFGQARASSRSAGLPRSNPQSGAAIPESPAGRSGRVLDLRKSLPTQSDSGSTARVLPGGSFARQPKAPVWRRGKRRFRSHARQRESHLEPPPYLEFPAEAYRPSQRTGVMRHLQKTPRHPLSAHRDDVAGHEGFLIPISSVQEPLRGLTIDSKPSTCRVYNHR